MPCLVLRWRTTPKVRSHKEKDFQHPHWQQLLSSQRRKREKIKAYLLPLLMLLFLRRCRQQPVFWDLVFISVTCPFYPLLLCLMSTREFNSRRFDRSAEFARSQEKLDSISTEESRRVPKEVRLAYGFFLISWIAFAESSPLWRCASRNSSRTRFHFIFFLIIIRASEETKRKSPCLSTLPLRVLSLSLSLSLPLSFC